MEKKINRKKYMKDYYSKRKCYLQNKSLIHSHKNELLKESNLKLALTNLLLNNSKRKYNCKIQKQSKHITLYFD